MPTRLAEEGLRFSSGPEDTGRSIEIVGRSSVMKSLFSELESLGASDASVLIEGETGVGKNLVARAIHEQSPRSSGPFVALSAANIPEPLFESELFGHVKGAFSGALENHQGLARAAEGGTLFLDEVGELSLANQAKLLFFLDSRAVRPVGGLRQTPVDFRLISATNRDLLDQVRQRAFRRDLFYRLRVIALRVPSLRERREDVPLLVSYFLDKLARKYGKPMPRISAGAMAKLEQYDWDGNVRELENEIERAVVMTEANGVVQPQMLLSSVSGVAQPLFQSSSLQESRLAAERSVILQALKRQRWNVSAAARELDISRVGLTRKLKRLGIRRPGYGSEGKTSAL
ncbi:MAG: sigma-54 dependent transcriptional regulator [Acidobacteriota bacterium]